MRQLFTIVIAIWMINSSLNYEDVNLSSSHESSGETYYVSSDGNDLQSGSLETPWKTIQHAAKNLKAGDKVLVRGGVYNESVVIEVSGTEREGEIIFQSYPGETAILDGRGLADPYGVIGFAIHGQSYLVIDGFEIRNYHSKIQDIVPMAIFVEGNSHHVQIKNNTIHHIETNAAVDEDLSGADAHGIAIYGNDENQSIQHILIENNELFALKLGSSEALVLNGNVETFTVTNNLVHDVDNIGISMIGFEWLVSDPNLDRAREGVVIGNTVYHVDSSRNPAYDGDMSADGIYVDGGRDILIERNRVHDANIGIEVASEHKDGNSSAVTVRSNLIYDCDITGIAIGGYDSKRGYTQGCHIINNTLYHNDKEHSGSGEIMAQYDIRDTVIKNNIIFANTQNLFIGNEYIQNQSSQVDYNLYFSAGGARNSEWLWKAIYYEGFEAYLTGTENDSHSIYANPRFVDKGSSDLRLRFVSPAIEGGTNAVDLGQYDLIGEKRLQGKNVDIGAYEGGELTKFERLLRRLASIWWFMERFFESLTP